MQNCYMIDSLVEYLKTVDTPTLCNAIELLNLRPREEGFTPLDVRCLFPELGRMCGYAVTAYVETVTRAEPRDNRKFVELYRMVERSPRPAIVVFQEIGARGEYAAHAGEVMSTILQRAGAIGLVSDCGVRDIPEVRALGFHYFARGSVAAHAHFRIAQVGVTVQVRGMVVEPGDLLHGDENGLALVPRAGRPELPDMVNRVREREGELLRFVRGPDFSLDGVEKRIVE